MRRMAGNDARMSERGAISIKAVLILLLMAGSIFIVVKVVPVYVEQRQVVYEVEELARIASVRNFNEDRINTEIEKVRTGNDLPEGSITLINKDKTVKVQVSYSRTVNLLLTNYVWRVDKSIVGKSL
jgi:hypothetical protein